MLRNLRSGLVRSGLADGDEEVEGAVAVAEGNPGVEPLGIGDAEAAAVGDIFEQTAQALGSLRRSWPGCGVGALVEGDEGIARPEILEGVHWVVLAAVASRPQGIGADREDLQRVEQSPGSAAPSARYQSLGYSTT